MFVCLTLKASFEESLAALTWPHPIVVACSSIITHLAHTAVYKHITAHTIKHTHTKHSKLTGISYYYSHIWSDLNICGIVCALSIANSTLLDWPLISQLILFCFIWYYLVMWLFCILCALSIANSTLLDWPIISQLILFCFIWYYLVMWLFCILVQNYTLCFFIGSPCYNVGYYNYNSISPLYTEWITLYNYSLSRNYDLLE